jgi:hypothetical protein
MKEEFGATELGPVGEEESPTSNKIEVKTRSLR